MGDDYTILKKHIKDSSSGWVSELGDVNVARLIAMKEGMEVLIECVARLSKRLDGLEAREDQIGQSSGKRTRRRPSKTSSSPSGSPTQKKKPSNELDLD